MMKTIRQHWAQHFRTSSFSTMALERQTSTVKTENIDLSVLWQCRAYFSALILCPYVAPLVILSYGFCACVPLLLRLAPNWNTRYNTCTRGSLSLLERARVEVMQVELADTKFGEESVCSMSSLLQTQDQKHDCQTASRRHTLDLDRPSTNYALPCHLFWSMLSVKVVNAVRILGNGPL